LNEHHPSKQILAKYQLPYVIVDLNDHCSNWEGALIKEHKVTLWINDRLNTSVQHAKNINATNIPLITFDDKGGGADYSDLHFAPLIFDSIKKPLNGRLINNLKYLILNPQIKNFKKRRNILRSILVTMGGSDTHGVTEKVVKDLKKIHDKVTVVVGPSFEHSDFFSQELPKGFLLKRSVPSLIEEFQYHDLAITGGGITPFEANASGLPCIVIANEPFEVPVGNALEQIGGAIFAGPHDSFRLPVLEARNNLAEMSKLGLENIDLNGTSRVVSEILNLIK
jgi:spore coat polysaccharide biosynthesis predicted glycosyltransferase SpsG